MHCALVILDAFANGTASPCVLSMCGNDVWDCGFLKLVKWLFQSVLSGCKGLSPVLTSCLTYVVVCGLNDTVTCKNG